MSSAGKSRESRVLYYNGKLPRFDNSEVVTFDNAIFVTPDGLIDQVASLDENDIVAFTEDGGEVRDLTGRTVLPGFIDGHMHLLTLGQSLRKLSLEGCLNLDDIRRRVTEFASSNREAPRILCRGWMHSMTGGEADATMLNDIDPRPIYIDSKDLHSTWCNAAALEEMGVKDMETPVGGIIERDETGAPTGLLGEATILTVVWPHLARIASMEEKLGALQGAIQAFNAAGYTGLVDMAMDENSWEAVLALRAANPNLPMRISAYWIITPSATKAGNIVQVDRAIALTKLYNATNSPDCRVIGIKVITDGIIDACTAHLTSPYTTGALPDPIWNKQTLIPVVNHAVAHGLQCALHAIGDASIKMAIDVLEPHCAPGHRHRIEHLELASAEDAKRLGDLSIIASIQPVHADPAILRAWPRLIGPERTKRAFAYREFADHGAPLALGSDAPTAPHGPLQNAYVATTRKSARHPSAGDEPVNPHFALGLCESLVAATEGAAFSSFSDERAGRLRKGMQADFVVCDMIWEKEKLLEAKVIETWFSGKKVYQIPE